MKKNVFNLLTKSSTKSIKVISTTMPIVGGGTAIVVTNVINEAPTEKKSRDSNKVEEQKRDEKEEKLFADWLKTAEATETYEKWRLSPNGLKSLSSKFSKTPDFKKHLDLWAKGTKRPYEYFKENDLQSSKYKSKYNSISMTTDGLSKVAPLFHIRGDFVQRKNNWVIENFSTSEKYQKWTQSSDFATQHKNWAKSEKNQKRLKGIWKSSFAKVFGSRKYLDLKKIKFSKDWWLKSSQSQSSIEDWVNSAQSNQKLLKFWKSSPHYQKKMKEWISFYPTKKSRDEFEKDETLWRDGAISFTLKYTRNNRISTIVKSLDEYVQAKQAWSAIGKSNWYNTNSFVDKYNAWKSSPAGINELKEKFSKVGTYASERDQWLLNDYTNKRSKDLWAQTNDALASYNDWKVLPASEQKLKTYWQLQNDYTTKRDQWARSHKPSKNVWTSTNDAQTKYDTWKVTQDGEKALHTFWETLTDYNTKKNQWIQNNPFNRPKDVWINEDVAIAKYNIWRVSPSAQNDLRVGFLASDEYAQKRDQWLINDYTNKRSKDLWSQTNDSADSHNNWKVLPASEQKLKTHWQSQNDYATKRDAWITNNKPDHTYWSKTAQAQTSYDAWKGTQAGEASLKTFWESLPNYTTKKNQWIQDNPLKRSKDTWVQLDTSTQGYNSWRITQQGREDLKAGYTASNTYQTQRDDWIWNMYDAKRPIEEWIKTPGGTSAFTNWKTLDISDSELKSEYLSSIVYENNRDNWLAANIGKRTKKDWMKSYLSNNFYNNWRVSSAGRKILQKEFIASSDYPSIRDNWIQNHYTNKRSKNIWSTLDDGNNKFNTWKKVQANQDDLKAHWKSLADYETKRDNWISQNKPSKDYWVKTVEAKNAFETWEALPNSSQLLDTHYQSLPEYVQKRDEWINENSNKQAKSVWLNLNDSREGYNKWRLSIKGQEVLKTQFQTSNDYVLDKDQWIVNNHVDMTKEQWSKTKTGKEKFLEWAKTADNEKILKDQFENSQEYADNKALWFALNKPSKEDWVQDPSQITHYNDWKATLAGYKLLKEHTISKFSLSRDTSAFPWKAKDSDVWLRENAGPFFEDWVQNNGGEAIIKNAWTNSRTSLSFEEWRKANHHSFTQRSNEHHVYTSNGQGQSDHAAWENGEHYYEEKYNQVESGETLTVGQKFYIDQANANKLYNEWDDPQRETKYKNAQYESDYLQWRDNELAGVSSGYNYYLSLDQSDTDYNSWVDDCELNDYHNSDDFVSNLNAWSSNYNNGFDIYKNDVKSNADYEKWALANPSPNNEANYINSPEYTQNLTNWKQKLSNGSTNAFKFYLTQNAANNDYTNWVPGVTTKKTFENWKKANGDSLHLQWINDAANHSRLEEEWKKSQDYKDKLENHLSVNKPSMGNWLFSQAARDKYQVWLTTPEGIKSITEIWEKSGAYQTSKSNWINGSHGNTSYQNWTSTSIAQNHLLKTFENSQIHYNDFNNWLNSNPKELKVVIYNWFFNHYKKTQPTAFENKLKTYYQTTTNFDQAKTKWLQENKTQSKDDWKNDAHFTTSFDNFKTSTYGQEKIKKVFHQSEYFQKVKNDVNSRRTKAQWKTTDHFKNQYVKWLSGEEAYNSLKTDFKSSSDYITLNATHKRSFRKWSNLPGYTRWNDLAAFERDYEQWKTTVDKAYWKRHTASREEKGYNREKNGYIVATYGSAGHYYYSWTRSVYARGYSRTRAGHDLWKNKVFDRSSRSTTKFNEWLNGEYSKIHYSKKQTTNNNYNQWIDPELDGTEGFKQAFYKYITKNHKADSDKWYDEFYNSSTATEMYEKWIDPQDLASLENEDLYEVVFDWYKREKISDDIYLQDGASNRDFNTWKGTNNDDQYLNSSDFDEDAKNYQAVLESEVNDFYNFVINDNDLVSAWNSYDGVELKSIFRGKPQFTSQFQTWVNDKANGLSLYQSLNQGEIDYKKSPQYQNDLVAYRDSDSSGGIRTVGYDYYLVNASNWKQSKDYITKREEWITNNSNYDTLSKLGWLRSSQGQSEFNKFLNDANLLESFKGAYLESQEFADNKDLWKRFKKLTKDEWIRTIDFDTYFNNFITTSKGQEMLKKYWGQTNAHQTAKQNWVNQQNYATTKNNWNSSLEAQAKLQEWLKSQEGQKAIQSAFEESAVYQLGKREFFERNLQKRNTLAWAKLDTSKNQFSSWKSSSTKNSDSLVAWEKAIADGDDDMAQKAMTWFNNKYSSNPLSDNAFETWYNNEDLTKWKAEFEKSSEYETYVKDQYDIDDWLEGEMVPFLRSWTLEKMLTSTKLYSQRIYVNSSYSVVRSTPHYELIQLILYYSNDRGYLNTHWKTSLNIGGLKYAKWFNNRNFSNSKTKKYLDYAMSLMHGPVSFSRSTVYSNIGNLYKRLIKPNKDTPAFLKWAKAEFNKSSNIALYNARLKSWVKERTKITNTDASLYKIEQYKKSSSNYQSDLNRWLGDEDNLLKGFAESQVAKTNHASWNDNDGLVVTDENTYINHVDYQTNLELWKKEKVNNVSNEMRQYINSVESILDFIDTRTDWLTSSAYNTGFTSFVSSGSPDEMKKEYSKGMELLNSYYQNLDSETYNKYEDSFSFDKDFQYYQDQKLNNGLSNLANYFLNLDHINKLYQEAKTQQDIGAYDQSSQAQIDLEKWNETNSGGRNEYNKWSEDSWFQSFTNGASYTQNLNNWVNKTEPGNDFSNGALIYIEENDLKSQYDQHKINDFEDRYNNDATSQNDFESWKNHVDNNQSNELKYYLSTSQSTTDYNNWIDPNGEGDYKASNVFIKDIDNWSSVKSNGIVNYEKDAQSNLDYSGWTDPNPIVYTEQDYKNNDAFRADFSNWKGALVNGVSNEMKYYLTTLDAIIDYSDWVDPHGEPFYQKTTDFQTNLDAWSSNKENGKSYYKDSVQGTKEYNAWTDPSPLYQTEAEYKSSDAYQGDFESWRDAIANKKTNGFSYYLNQNQATTDYSSWVDPNGETKYQNDPLYQSNFESWRDAVIGNKTNSFSYYLNQPQSTTDYDNWADLDGENDYLATNDYQNSINEWSKVKANGIVSYLNSQQSDTDYATWNDPTPLYPDASAYKGEGTYQNDFESWRDGLTNNQVNGFNQYLTNNQSTIDYNSWVDPTGESRYQVNIAFQSDFENWRDDFNNKQAKGFGYYQNDSQSTSDYDNWVDLAGEPAYRLSNAFLNRFNLWLGNNNFEVDYKDSVQLNKDWDELLDQEYAKTNQSQALLSSLSNKHIKNAFKQSNDFQEYYERWHDPLVRTERKYNLNEESAQDQGEYYQDLENKRQAYASSNQSTSDYTTFFNQNFNVESYLNDDMSTTHFNEWKVDDRNTLDLFKNTDEIFDLFSNYNTNLPEYTIKYMSSNDYIVGLQNFVLNNFESSFKFYKKTYAKSLYKKWEDPVGIEPNEDLFKKSTHYLKVVSEWSKDTKNGLTPFSSSIIANSMFELWKEKQEK